MKRTKKNGTRTQRKCRFNTRTFKFFLSWDEIGEGRWRGEGKRGAEVRETGAKERSLERKKIEANWITTARLFSARRAVVIQFASIFFRSSDLSLAPVSLTSAPLFPSPLQRPSPISSQERKNLKVRALNLHFRCVRVPFFSFISSRPSALFVHPLGEM